MTDTPDQRSQDQKSQNGKQAKKTEVIEVRLPFEKKQSFMEACKADEQTASSVLRGAIDQYLLTGNLGAKPSKYRSFSMMITGIIIGGAIFGLATMDNGSFALSTAVPNSLSKETVDQPDGKYAAISNPLIKLQFSKLDRNSDYVLDMSEFSSVKDYGHLVGPLDFSEPIIVAPDSYKILKSDYEEFSRGPLRMGKCLGSILKTRNRAMAQSFYLIDEDRDNKLTFVEYANHPKFPNLRKMEEAFAALDKNKNGNLSLAETRIKIKKWTASHDLRKNKHYLNSFPVPKGCLSDSDQAGEIDYDDLKKEDVQKLERKLIANHEASKIKNLLIVGFGKYERMYEPNSKGGVSKERFNTLDNDNNGELSFQEFIVWYL